jgi:hypothetical protein
VIVHLDPAGDAAAHRETSHHSEKIGAPRQPDRRAEPRF